jgi:putative flippase GtrA
MALFGLGISVNIAAPVAFILAAMANYLLCIFLLFRHKARWSPAVEIAVYWFVVGIVCLLDLGATKFLLSMGFGPSMSKILASVMGLLFNFMGRRFFVFPEPSSGPWKPQTDK